MTNSEQTKPASTLFYRQEFRRGWPVLVGSLLCFMISVVAIPPYTIGIYLKPLAEEFAVSRSAIASTAILSAFIIMILAPIVGGLADRFGVRRLLAGSLIAMAGVYLLQATVMRSFAAYLALTALLYIAGAATIPVVFTRAINAWFDRSRGLALGCALAGTGITAVIAPPLVTIISEEFGWRAAFAATGALVLLLTPPIVWLVRMPSEAGNAPELGPQETVGMSTADAVRTRQFWLLAIAIALQSTAALGLSIHLIPMLTDRGLTARAAAEIFALSGLAITFGRLGIGPLLDVFFAPRLAAIVAAIFAAGCLLLVVGELRFAPVTAATIGFALGAEVDFLGYLASRYFGLKNYGRIYGMLYSAFAVGAGTGGIWVGAFFDRTGSYDGAYLVAAGLMVPTIILLSLLPAFPRR